MAADPTRPCPFVAWHLSCQNESPIDAWSAVHVAVGAGARAIGMEPDTYVTLAIIYEAVEQFLEKRPGNMFGTSRPESLDNAVFDVLTGLLGYWIASKSLHRH